MYFTSVNNYNNTYQRTEKLLEFNVFQINQNFFSRNTHQNITKTIVKKLIMAQMTYLSINFKVSLIMFRETDLTLMNEVSGNIFVYYYFRMISD